MIVQEDHITVKLGSLVFTSYKTPNIELRLDEVAIDGWYDGVAMRRISEPRPTKWGDFPTPGYLGSRLVTLTGTAIAPDFVTLQAMRDEFMSVLVYGQYEMMTVHTPSTGDRFLEVGLEAAPKWKKVTDKFASFKMDLIAPDPRIYSVEHSWTMAGKVNEGGLAYPLTYDLKYGNDEPNETQFIENKGNVDAWPIMIVNGNLPDGFSLSDGAGQIVKYDGPVSLSAPVVVDFARGTAKQRGKDRTSHLVRRQWFGVPPGNTMQPRFDFYDDGLGEGGAKWVEVRLRDTWI